MEPIRITQVSHFAYTLVEKGLGVSCDFATNLLVTELRLDIRIACDGLQQKFQHAEYFTCDHLISQPIFIWFSNGFHH